MWILYIFRGIIGMMLLASAILGIATTQTDYDDTFKKWLEPFGLEPLHLALLLVFLAAVLYSGHLHIAYRKLLRSPLHPDTREHHKILLGSLSKIDNFTTPLFTGKEIGELVNNSPTGFKFFPDIFVSLDANREISVLLGMEVLPEWPYLCKHLGKLLPKKEIDEWKQNINTGLAWKIELYDAIRDLITETLQLNVCQQGTEGINPLCLNLAYDCVYESVILEQNWRWNFEFFSNGNLNSSILIGPTGTHLVRSTDKQKLEDAQKLLEELPNIFRIDGKDDIEKTALVARAKLGHTLMSIKPYAFIKPLSEIYNIQRSLPRNSKCKRCPS